MTKSERAVVEQCAAVCRRLAEVQRSGGTGASDKEELERFNLLKQAEREIKMLARKAGER